MVKNKTVLRFDTVLAGSIIADWVTADKVKLITN